MTRPFGFTRAINIRDIFGSEFTLSMNVHASHERDEYS
jgi:hypothetical protein